VFIPVYVAIFLLYIHPSAFSGFSAREKTATLGIIIYNIVFYPLLSVLLLRAVGFIDSLYLRTQKDRIIPYIASGIFFFWAYTVFKQQPQYPLLLTSYVLGIFLASSLALIANIYLKISMHAIGMGGWLGLFFIIAGSSSMLMTWPLCAVILITGFVCTSRLLTRSHEPQEIYLGLLVGITTQVVAAAVVL
jgi:nitrate reductase NapE component